MIKTKKRAHDSHIVRAWRKPQVESRSAQLKTSIWLKLYVIRAVIDSDLWSCRACPGNNRELADNHGQSPGNVWRNCLSPTRVSYRKVIGYCF